MDGFRPTDQSSFSLWFTLLNTAVSAGDVEDMNVDKVIAAVDKLYAAANSRLDIVKEFVEKQNASQQMQEQLLQNAALSGQPS